MYMFMSDARLAHIADCPTHIHMLSVDIFCIPAPCQNGRVGVSNVEEKKLDLSSC